MSYDPEEIYKYPVPQGYGDTFFAYVYDGGALPLVVSSNYQGLNIPVLDGDFVNRFVTGFETIGEGFQIYDSLLRQCFSDYALLGDYNPTGLMVLPERLYPVTNAIRFDIRNASPQDTGIIAGTTLYSSQLIFYGVRRRALHYSDPESSSYNYYEKDYEVGLESSLVATYQLSINQYGANAVTGAINPPQTEKILIRDFDFELRRVEMQYTAGISQFKITLYDNYGNATSNLPILCNKFFHFDPRHSSGELNFQPCPPILYKVGSYIKFDIQSLLTPTIAPDLPVVYNLLFHGIRRIPCS